MKNSSREDKLIFPGIKSTHSSQLQPHSGYVASSPLKGRIVQSVPRRRRRVILRGPIWCVCVCVCAQQFLKDQLVIVGERGALC